MTDRINVITVVLEKDIREDDVEPILVAIRCLRGVLRVVPHPVDSLTAFAVESRVRRDIFDRLMAALREDQK